MSLGAWQGTEDGPHVGPGTERPRARLGPRPDPADLADLRPGGDDDRLLGRPAAERLARPGEQGLRPLVLRRAGRLARGGDLPQGWPGLPVHVSPFGRGDAGD